MLHKLVKLKSSAHKLWESIKRSTSATRRSFATTNEVCDKLTKLMAANRYKSLNDRYVLDELVGIAYLKARDKHFNVSHDMKSSLFISSYNAEYFDAEALSLAHIFNTIHIEYTTTGMFNTVDFILSNLRNLSRPITIDISVCVNGVFSDVMKLIKKYNCVTGIVVDDLTAYQQAVICACENITNIVMLKYIPAIIGKNLTKLAIRTCVDIESGMLFAIIKNSNIKSLEIGLMYTDLRNDISEFVNCILESKVTDLTLNPDYDIYRTSPINDKIIAACIGLATYKLQHLNVCRVTVNYCQIIEFLQTKLLSIAVYDFIGGGTLGNFNATESENIIRILSLNTTMIDFPILARFLPETKNIFERNKKLQFHVVSEHIVDIVIAMNNVVDEPYLLLEIILLTQQCYELLSRKFFVDIILHTLESIRKIKQQ